MFRVLFGFFGVLAFWGLGDEGLGFRVVMRNLVRVARVGIYSRYYPSLFYLKFKVPQSLNPESQQGGLKICVECGTSGRFEVKCRGFGGLSGFGGFEGFRVKGLRGLGFKEFRV